MRFLSPVRAAVIAILAAGCNQIIGLDPGLDRPDAAGSGGATASSTTTVTSTGSGGAGGGHGETCTPGTTSPCYSGAPGTEGVGQCQGGQMTCAMDGSGYGACMGEVVPATEDCATQGDEDCDGIACSDLVWAHLYGDVSAQAAQVVTVDAAGNVLAAGSLTGSAVFGAQTLVSNGSTDVFLAKLDPAGTVIWAKRYGDNSTQVVGGIAADAQGDVIVGGHFQSTIDFGSGTLTSAGSSDVYVAKLDPSGTGLWSVRFGDTAGQHLTGVALLPGGDVIITGDFAGTMTFGGTMLSNTGMGSAAFLARLSGASGAPVWARVYADSAGMQATVPQALGTDGAGHIIVGGSLGGTVAFGTTILTGTQGKAVFLAALGSTGAPLWSKAFSVTQTPFKIMSLAATSGGEITIAGQAGASVDFGGGATGSGGIYGVRFSSAGVYLWGRIFGGTAGSTINAAIDAAGDVVLAGGFTGDMDFSMGKSPLTNTGTMTDTFVAKLSPAGAHLWSKMFADTTGPDAAKAVAVDPVSQRVVVVGQQTGIVDYGAGPLTGIGGGDALVMEFQP